MKELNTLTVQIGGGRLIEREEVREEVGCR